MEKSEKFQKPQNKIGLLRSRGKLGIGKPEYLNENCWLVKTLGYPPYERCQYCELKFRHCPFFHYQIISLILILFFLTLSFLIEGRVSKLVIISIFTLVIVYGYFFNKSTEKIIKVNFAQRKANEALKELTETLEKRVKWRTKELEKAYLELKELDKTKTEFLSVASHQLRTPLSAIKGYISMVLEGSYGELPQSAKRPINNVYLSNERLIKLVNDLLDVSKIELGKVKMEFSLTSIEELVEDVVKELSIQAQSKNIYLKWQKPSKFLPKISIDKTKIRNALLNIIDNAIKYTQVGGIMVMVDLKELSDKKSSILIKIKDTGAGMTKKEISSLFQSFSRGKTGKQLWAEGSGLGLYVAKQYVEMHQGKIWAESEGKNKGSVFYIELPNK